MHTRKSKTIFFVLEGFNALATTYYSSYVYFLLRDRFDFRNLGNLSAAALAGFVYIFAAWQGGRFAQRFGYFTALKTGFAATSGDLVIVQDADLEYDPADYETLARPILTGKADVVFGSRFAGSGAHRVLYFWHYVGNKALTLLSNMATNLNLTDMESGYKMFRREMMAKIQIEENRFGFEPEVTAKIAQMGCHIYEVGISYHGRTYNEGKKIGWRDGVRAIICILKYNLRRRRPKRPWQLRRCRQRPPRPPRWQHL